MEKQFSLALVTGASSGIGEAICYLLAEKGINLMITARNTAKLQHLKDTLPVEVTIITADLSDRQDRKKVIKAIHEKKPDLVINNAGFGFYGEAIRIGSQKQLDMFEVNGAAVMEIAIESGKALKEANKTGTILNVSSAAAFQFFPWFAVYAATKSFVNSFSLSFDEEMKSYGIRSLVNCPGMVATDFSRRAAGGHKAPKRSLVMDVEYVVAQIWKQIQQGKAVQVVDWKYRIATFLSRFIIPRWVMAPLMRKNMENRLR